MGQSDLRHRSRQLSTVSFRSASPPFEGAHTYHNRSGALYSHAAAKLVFVRLFRRSRHLYTHTVLGWTVWTILCFAATALAFVLAAAVPVFSDLTGITASLFASWYTYGIAGFFWIYDTYYMGGEGIRALRRRWAGTVVALLTILSGAFICVAGTYVSVKVRGDPLHLCLSSYSWLQLIADAYAGGTVGRPFAC